METKLEILKHELSIGNSDNLENALQDRTVKPEDRVGKDGFTLIHWACYYGMQEALQTLMLYDGAVNALETHGWTPAHICAIQGRDNCLQILLKYGANIHIEDSKGYTSGHLASAHGNTYTLRTILDTGYNLEAKDHRKWTAVHHAAFHGRYGVLQLLAKKGANLMSADKEGNIAAHLAAGEGHIDCLRLLVYYENDPLQVINSYNDRGATPKDLSIQFQKQHCADFLASAKSEAELDEEEEDDDGGIKAAYEGNLQLLSMLVLEGHCNVNHTDKYGSTPAHKAAGSGHADCLQWLIDHGADVTLQNNMKETPLDVAKKFAQIECIKLLGGKHFDTEEEDQQVDPLQSMEKVQEHIYKLKQALTIAKKRYEDMGGVIEEDNAEEIREKTRLIVKLESQLEAEREKREGLEKETDELRAKLYQAKQELVQYQTTHHTTGEDLETTPIPNHKQSKLPKMKSKVLEGGGAYFNIQ